MAKEEKPKKTDGKTDAIEIPGIKVSLLEIRLVGDSPLICHAWSAKAKKQMLDKQMKKAKAAKVAKDPEQDYKDSLYHLPDGGYGFPSVAFKSAAVSACRNVDGIPMTLARGAFHIMGDMVTLDSPEGPSMREDMVRIAMGTADIRYRGEFRDWSAKIRIRYNENVLGVGQIINLFNTGGFAVGVGEWRPEKKGSFGMFHVATEGE